MPNLGAIGSNTIFCEISLVTVPEAPISATPEDEVLSGEALIPELTFRALPEPKRSVGSSNLAKLGLWWAVAEE